MHPNARFHWKDEPALRDFVADQSFGALVLQTPEGLRAAHAPVILLGDNRIGFHLARGNALTAHLDGARALFLVQGAHGYISPDWYGIDDQVPTWNYLAVELEGIATRTDEAGLLAIIDALSAEHERRLAPKPVWTRDKMTPGLAEKMARAITGFTLEIDQWRGTAKLGQNKAPDVREAAAEGAAAAGNASLATLMRAPPA